MFVIQTCNTLNDQKLLKKTQKSIFLETGAFPDALDARLRSGALAPGTDTVASISCKFQLKWWPLCREQAIFMFVFFKRA